MESSRMRMMRRVAAISSWRRNLKPNFWRMCSDAALPFSSSARVGHPELPQPQLQPRKARRQQARNHFAVEECDAPDHLGHPPGETFTAKACAGEPAQEVEKLGPMFFVSKR